jgi:hypothetical protein
LSAAALVFCFGVCVAIEDFVVVSLDDATHIWHTAVTDLQVVAVEQFSKFVSLREVLIDEAKE